MCDDINQMCDDINQMCEDINQMCEDINQMCDDINQMCDDINQMCDDINQMCDDISCPCMMLPALIIIPPKVHSTHRVLVSNRKCNSSSCTTTEPYRYLLFFNWAENFTKDGNT